MIKPELRRHAIGASEIAAVMGWDPRRTALQVWLDKQGLVESRPPTYRMRRGKFLERLLIEQEYTALTGRAVNYWDKSEYDPERPYMVVTPDGLCPDLRRGVEAKVVSYDQRDLWNEGPPPHVYLQCAWSMAFYGYDRWDVIVAIADDEPEVWTVDRDQELIDVIVNRAVDFYSRYLLPEQQPPIDGSAASAVYLQRKFPRHKKPDIRPATTQEILMLERYARVRAEFKDVKARKDLLENQLTEAVGEAEGIAWEAGKFTWRKTRDSTYVDWQSMAIALNYRFIKDEAKRAELQESYVKPKPGYRKIHFDYKAAAGQVEEEAVA